MYGIMLSGNTDSFASFFPTWITFIPFSPLIAKARTSKTMLNKSDKSGHPCTGPDFRGNAFNFSPLSMLLTVDFPYKPLLYVPFIICYYMFPLHPLSGVFVIIDVEFYENLFLHLLI